MRYGNAGVRETDKMIAMETCGMSHRKNRKHRPELQSHTANRRRPTRSGVRRYRWSHRNSPRVPMEPNAWGERPTAYAKRAPMTETVSKDTEQEGRQCYRIDQRDRRKEKRLRARSGHSQRATVKPTAGADKATTKKERGMERVSDSNKASK